MASTKRKTPKLGPMDAGFLTPLITDFGANLAALGHSRLTIGGYTDSARHFTAWMLDGGIALALQPARWVATVPMHWPASGTGC